MFFLRFFFFLFKAAWNILLKSHHSNKGCCDEAMTHPPHCTCVEPTLGLSRPMACRKGQSSLSLTLWPRKFSFSKITMVVRLWMACSRLLVSSPSPQCAEPADNWDWVVSLLFLSSVAHLSDCSLPSVTHFYFPLSHAVAPTSHFPLSHYSLSLQVSQA